MPEIMLQAAIFEIVSEDVGTHPLPTRVAKEFGVTDHPRTFSYEAMLYANGKYRNNWGKGASVPDISQPETQMWFYFAAHYIDMGVEAIHFGQVELMGKLDPKHVAWDGLLTRCGLMPGCMRGEASCCATRMCPAAEF